MPYGFGFSRESRATLAKRANVKRVERLRVYERLTKKSVPAIGAKTVWGTLTTGFDGAGMRIAVIDSGLDYTHAMFGGAGTKEAYQSNDATKIEEGTFPTDKVDGWDFAGKDYSGADDVPLPDGDPLDRSGYGHGTHVAGIVAGVGVTNRGVRMRATIIAGLDYSEFLLRPGVAPKAKLFALKIFGDNAPGTTNLVLDALEWCADPNADNDFSDRLDVVNLSLGSTLGLEEKHEAEAEVFTNLTRLGSVIVSGAGNSNNNNFYLVAAPGVERSVIAVGSAKLDGKTVYRMAAHSARGPSAPHSLLKPEIIAPGELIQSARMGTGTGDRVVQRHLSGRTARRRGGGPGQAGASRLGRNRDQGAAAQHGQSVAAQKRHRLSRVARRSRFSRCGTGGDHHRDGAWRRGFRRVDHAVARRAGPGQAVGGDTANPGDQPR